eukprot:1160985-Pelagomonas_calceolata.AAC.13
MVSYAHSCEGLLYLITRFSSTYLCEGLHQGGGQQERQGNIVDGIGQRVRVLNLASKHTQMV